MNKLESKEVGNKNNNMKEGSGDSGGEPKCGKRRSQCCGF